MSDNNESSVNTGGGAIIGGNAIVSRDLIGRDSYNIQYNAEKIIIHPPYNDPYSEYLQRLYDRVENFLEQTLRIVSEAKIGREQTIQLRFKYLPGVLNTEQEYIPQADPLVTIIGKRYAEAREIYNDFRTVYTEFKGRVLLLGEPGAGKTMSLLFFARDSILSRMRDPSQPLPILGIVPTWDYHQQPTISEWLQSSFNSPDNVEDILADGKGLLLLDGLDELMPDIFDGRDPQWLFVQNLPKKTG